MPEGQEINFKKHTGKETLIKVISEKQINRGSFGAIFDTEIEIGGRRKRMIVKKYDFWDSNNRMNHLKHVFNIYQIAKKAKLKVFPTFRISEQGESIIMTSGFRDNQICVGTNRSREENEWPIDLEFKDLDKFLEKFFSEAIKAAHSGLRISGDVVFLVMEKGNPTELDFVFGDLDGIQESSLYISTTAYENLSCMKSTLLYLLSNIFKPNKLPENVEQKINDYFDKFKTISKKLNNE